MSLKDECSIKDTTVLRNLILENPELPVLIFCGEESWSGEYGYTQACSSRGEIETLTLYGEMWLNEDDYREKLVDDLCDDEFYELMTDEEFYKAIDEIVEKTEFVDAIVIWVG